MPVYAFGPFELDLDAFELRRGDARIEIGQKPFDALAYLVQHARQLITTEQFIRQVWGVSSMSPSTVPTCVAAIRKALSDDPARPRYLETVRGRGYRFIIDPVVRHKESSGVATQVPAPLQRHLEEHSAFVGRSREIEILRTALASAMRGAARIVLFFGEPGIGKTRLLEEFIPLAHQAGAHCAIARCRENEGAPALWPWIQIIRGYSGVSGTSRVRSESPLVPPILKRIDPQLQAEAGGAERLASLDAPKARFRLFDAVTLFLRTAAKEHPLVLLFDDLHRSDVSSLLLLRFAVRELREAPILFVGTFRDTEAGEDARTASVLGELAREGMARSVQLTGLSREDIDVLVSELGLENGPGGTLATALHDRSAGNPFFLTQLIRLFEGRTRPEPHTLAASEMPALPGGLREAILGQIEGLPARTREILVAASAEGREFSATVLATAVEDTIERILEHLTPAVQRRIVNPNPEIPGHYRFAHVLLRDALYEELPAPDRVRLHLRIGQALSRANEANLGPVSAELAHHFFEAAPAGGAAAAVRYSKLAAEWATERLAYEDAPRHYRRALKALDLTQRPSPLERGKLLLALGQAELRAEERTRGRETLARVAAVARSIGEPELLAQAALSLAPGPLAIEAGVYDSLLVSLLEEALGALASDHGVLRAQLLARLSLALTWGDAEARRRSLSKEALETARRLDDRQTLAHALIARHGVLGGPAYLDQRLEIANEIGALAGPSRDPTLWFMHRVLHITDLLERGNMEALDREVGLYAREASAIQLPYFAWYTPLFKAMRARMSGRFEDARHLADEFYSIGQRVNDENAAHSYGSHQVLQSWEDARTEDAVRLCEAYVERFPSVIGWRSALACFYHEDGRLETARREFECVATRGFENVPRNEVWNITIAMLSLGCAWLHDRERARALYDLLLPGVEHYVVLGFGVASLGSVSQYLGMLAAAMNRWDEATRHFDHAVEQNLRIGALPWVAHTRYEHARALSLRTGSSSRDRAQREAAEALQIAERLGMKNIHAKASALLQAAPAPPVRS